MKKDGQILGNFSLIYGTDMIKIKKKHNLYMKEYYKLYPWKFYHNKIKTRCENPKSDKFKYYGGKGIKNQLTIEDVKFLWFRDKAYLMKKPSIDRIKSDKNYTLDNCRFLEMEINRINGHKKPILQFDLKGNFIKEWESIIEVEKILKISSSCICCNLKDKTKKSHSFIWKYKGE